MHTDDDYKESEIEEENDYSNFYNNNYDEEEVVVKDDNNDKTNKKVIIIIVVLAVILIALIIVLLLILKKKDPVDFNLTLQNVTGDAWAKENVTINIDVPDDKELKSLKYTINCDSKCDYVNVTDKKIVISNNGTSVVTVISTNTDNVENKKNITVKIDNTKPVVTLSPNDTNIKSNTPVTVCALCTDKESGCKKEKVCKDFDKTSKDQTITVEDNAGNKSVSNKFTVTIGNSSATPVNNPTCSLSVSGSGVVTAKYSNADKYRGFSSSYSGTNETAKQLNLGNNETSKITYYVKNSSNKTSSCSISVKASCECLYRADASGGYKCYKTKVKTVNNPKSASECNGAQRKTNTSCDFYKDEGLTCQYTLVSTK